MFNTAKSDLSGSSFCVEGTAVVLSAKNDGFSTATIIFHERIVSLPRENRLFLGLTSAVAESRVEEETIVCPHFHLSETRRKIKLWWGVLVY